MHPKDTMDSLKRIEVIEASPKKSYRLKKIS